VRLLPWLSLLACLLCGCRAAGNHMPNDYRIVGYVTGRTQIHRIDSTKLTHVNYAFGHVSEDGGIVIDPKHAPEHLAQLQALKAKNPKLKVLLSVGGWGADHFSDAALSDESRAKFADSGVELMKRYALDGIDLDWEYPGQPGPGIKFRPEDKHNFTLMLKALRERLDALGDERKRAADDRYLLTIASADHEYFDHTEMDVLHVYLDWINVMAYDFFNSLTPVTGHHTGLYRSAGADPNSRWTEASIKQHLAAGIPAKKLVVGVAFYGRSFIAGDAQHPLNTPYEKYVDAPSFHDLQQKYINQNDYQRRWDDDAKAPYLFNPQTRALVTYDDEQSLREKVKFIKAHRLGGVMYWEHAHDPDEVLLDVLHKGLRAGQQTRP
jgi:chitinase